MTASVVPRIFPHAQAVVDHPERGRLGNTEDSNSSSRKLRTRSSIACSENELDFRLDLKTDAYGDEDNYWTILDTENGAAVRIGGSLQKEAEYHYRECLPSCGSYEFTLFDIWGDGLTKVSMDSYFNVTVDGAPILSLSQDQAKTEEFLFKRIEFYGGSKCSEVSSLKIVVKDPTLTQKMCLQPKNPMKGDFTVAAKPCREGKKIQEWSTDHLGQFRNAYKDGTWCMTKVGASIVLDDACYESYHEDYSTNFMYNKFTGTIHLFNKNEKALTYNHRENSVRVRDYANPDESAAQRQYFSIEKIYSVVTSS